jgi:hypothetical protein
VLDPAVKIAFHSDGKIFSIIPNSIEAGLGILYPAQPKSMDPARVKNLYGDKPTFWGTVDTQEVSPVGTVGDVGKETVGGSTGTAL